MADRDAGSSADAAGRPLVRVRGRLSRATVRKGTGSEHETWVLASPSHGDVVLKRLGANPFELGDPPATLGAEVEAEGYLLNQEMRYTTLREV
jgi:hypothetical protein